MSKRGMNNRQIGFYLPDDLYLKVHRKVNESVYERTMSAIMRALLRKWVRNEIDLDSREVLHDKY